MFLGTGPLAALPPTTTFNLTGVGSGANLAGVYTSPYSGTVSPGTPTIPVICDDFADDSYVPEQWTANVTSLSSLTPGTPDTILKWLTGANGESATETLTLNGASYTLNQAQAYTVAAVLAVEILSSGAGPAQEDLSYAMWGLFDPTGTTNDLPNDLGAFTWLQYYGYNSDETIAVNDLQTAIKYVAANNLGPGNYANVTIYSYDTLGGANPNGPTCNGGTCPNSPPQEFIAVRMAEPPSAALFLLDLLFVAGLTLFVRRRLKLTPA
jgi:hypothetical protein